MKKLKLVLPKTLFNFNPETDIVFFLAGPIRGGGDWQKTAINILQEFTTGVPEQMNVYVVCPCRYDSTHELYPLKFIGIPENEYTDEQKKITESQTNWERYYLEIAGRYGCITFFLAKEDPSNPRKKEEGPYARDTYGELGEWRARLYYEHKYADTRMNLFIGADPEFPGLEQIHKNYRRMLFEGFKISSSLKELLERATTSRNWWKK